MSKMTVNSEYFEDMFGLRFAHLNGAILFLYSLTLLLTISSDTEMLDYIKKYFLKYLRFTNDMN